MINLYGKTEVFDHVLGNGDLLQTRITCKQRAADHWAHDQWVVSATLMATGQPDREIMSAEEMTTPYHWHDHDHMIRAASVALVDYHLETTDPRHEGSDLNSLLIDLGGKLVDNC